VALAAAIDDWAAVRRDRKRDGAGAEALSAVARAADPDPWRSGLRDALDRPDHEARRSELKKLAGTAEFTPLGPVSLDLLGRALADAGDAEAAEAVLRRAQRRHPDDVWINHDLAGALEKLARRSEAIRYYAAARAIRPDTAHELAHALQNQGEGEEALAVFEDLVALRPENGRHWGCLGNLRQQLGDRAGAAVALGKAVAPSREAIRLRPDDAQTHGALGLALMRQGKLDEAIAEGREAIRLQPDFAMFHFNLATALSTRGSGDEAIAEYREAIRLRPDDPVAHHNLGWALQQQGKPEEAIAEYRAALRIRPDDADHHFGLGFSLQGQGKLEEAIAEYRAALRIQPDHASARNNLGWLLAKKGEPTLAAEALEDARKAVALDPKNGGWQNTLALAEYRAGHFAEAIAAAERSIELIRPGVDASNWFFLAMAHARRGEADRARGFFDWAVAWTRKNAPKNPELLQFWREAAALLGRPGPDAAQPARLSDLPADVFVH
jgi:tetratricopeptide (TPR) repeat protein